MVSRSKLHALTLGIREVNSGSECKTGHAEISVRVPSAFRGGPVTATCGDCKKSLTVPD